MVKKLNVATQARAVFQPEKALAGGCASNSGEAVGMEGIVDGKQRKLVNYQKVEMSRKKLLNCLEISYAP